MVLGGVENTSSSAYTAQCFSTAGVESTMVPSISNRNPSKDTVTGAPVYPILAVFLHYSSERDLSLASEYDDPQHGVVRKERQKKRA